MMEQNGILLLGKKIILVLSFVAISIAIASDGATLYKKCAICHGQKAEKKAMNRSQIIQGWDANKTEASLNEYKNGTFKDPMKNLMKNNIKTYSDEDIKTVSKYISKLQ